MKLFLQNKVNTPAIILALCRKMTMRHKIKLLTQSDALKFVTIASSIKEDVYLTNENHQLVVSAKSLLGVRYGQIEWHDLYVECERDLYFEMNEFLAD